VAHEAQPRFLAQPFAKQAGFGVGGRDMGVIAARLAVKVPLAIAARARSKPRPGQVVKLPDRE
jgi:hypothetical protein